MKADRKTLSKIALNDAAQEMPTRDLEQVILAVFKHAELPRTTPDLEAEYQKNALILKALLYRQTLVLESLLNNARHVRFEKSASLH